MKVAPGPRSRASHGACTKRAAIVTASVLAGFATLPSPAVFLEHVALGLSMRASYKTIGGFDWADWSFTGDHAVPAVAANDFAPPSGTAAQEG